MIEKTIAHNLEFIKFVERGYSTLDVIFCIKTGYCKYKKR